MKKYFYLTLLLLVSFAYVKGQAYHKLKPGEKVPDVQFTVLENDKLHAGKISDYKGKLLILDYWHKWCGSCLAAFPRLTALQQKYKDRVVILPISFLHTPKVVADFVKGRKGTDGEISLSLAIMPSTNNALFQSLPTVGYPYDVWIDEHGNFITASDASDITDKSLNAALQKKDVGFKRRNYQVDFKARKPFLTDNNGGPDSAFIYRSLISKGIDSVSQYQSMSFEKSGIHIFYGNKIALELLKYSLKDGLSDDAYNKLIVVDEELKNRLAPDSVFLTREWRKDNTFCYDLVLPEGYSKKEAFTIMHQDLDRFYKVNSKFEELEMNCYVLVVAEGHYLIQSKEIPGLVQISNNRLLLKGRTPETLLNYIGNRYSPILLNETAYRNPIDVNIQLTQYFDVAFYNNQLAAYGLKLVQAKRKIKVIAIHANEKRQE